MTNGSVEKVFHLESCFKMNPSSGYISLEEEKYKALKFTRTTIINCEIAAVLDIKVHGTQKFKMTGKRPRLLSQMQHNKRYDGSDWL